MSLKSISVIFVILLGLEPVGCSAIQENTDTLCDIRHSFDSIKMDKPICRNMSFEQMLVVQDQEGWDNLSKSIKDRVDDGCKDLLVSVTANVLKYGSKPFKLEHINNGNVNIKIVAKNTLMIPEGQIFDKKDLSRVEIHHWVMPCKKFGLNNLAFDDRNKNLSLFDDVFLIDSKIEEVNKYGEEEIQNRDGSLYKRIVKIWRFPTNLGDLQESECEDFYILLTRNWTSCRHRVLKVEGGYLYFYLKSEDAESLYQMCMDPNVDTKTYMAKPRCRYLNRPYRNGVFFKQGYIYVPNSLSEVRVCRNAQFFVVSDCYLNFLEINGFRIIGASAYSSIYVPNSRFKDQLWIRDNVFSNLSASAINIDNSENVCIYNNRIRQTRTNAIRCSGDNLTIWKNSLKDVGYMLQTTAISFSGTNIHVCENDIQDFYYSAIGMGGTTSNENCKPLTYVVEHNTVTYSSLFFNNYKEKTLADGGGIYVGPQNTRGIIRYNVIKGIRGTGANRGIFLDDGAKNLAIYGNLIADTDNSYDIDLRRCTTYSKDIPDHNTNNYIFHNIMTGGYRFQDTGKDDSRCIGGENLLLGIGNIQKKAVELESSIHDYTLEGCKYINRKVVIPKQYEYLLDSLCIDSFVRRHISFR